MSMPSRRIRPGSTVVEAAGDPPLHQRVLLAMREHAIGGEADRWRGRLLRDETRRCRSGEPAGQQGPDEEHPSDWSEYWHHESFWPYLSVYFPFRRDTRVASRTMTSRPSSTGIAHVSLVADRVFLLDLEGRPCRDARRSAIRYWSGTRTCFGVSSTDACSASRPSVAQRMAPVFASTATNCPRRRVESPYRIPSAYTGELMYIATSAFFQIGVASQRLPDRASRYACVPLPDAGDDELGARPDGRHDVLVPLVGERARSRARRQCRRRPRRASGWSSSRSATCPQASATTGDA